MKTDLLIIGAGPAGMAAADIVADYDIDITVVDEQARAGGQIYRQPPEKFTVSHWLSGRLHREGKALLRKIAVNDKIHWRMQTTVLGIFQSADADSPYRYRAALSSLGGSCQLEAKCILIAPGCHDMPVIFPGWNTPGVMAAGGIQAFVKSQQLLPGKRFLFAGTHPLQLVVADQIVQAGGDVAGVIFAQTFSRVFTLLKKPLVLIRHFNKFLYIALTLWRLYRAGVPVTFGKTVSAAKGTDALESVRITTLHADGKILKDSSTEVECDRLGLCFSFLASSELARQCGANSYWSSTAGGWLIHHDEWMQSNVPGIYVAGEITGVAGAEVAMEEGRLAGFGIAGSLGVLDSEHAEHAALSARRKLKGLQPFADLLKELSYPGQNLLRQMSDDESTLCKCEEITVGEFKRCLRENRYASSANAAKLVARTGMGLCQGRYCHYYVTQLIADEKGISAEKVGPFTSRFPSKPVRISELLK